MNSRAKCADARPAVPRADGVMRLPTAFVKVNILRLNGGAPSPTG
jgi:hypothetical protein